MPPPACLAAPPQKEIKHRYGKEYFSGFIGLCFIYIPAFFPIAVTSDRFHYLQIAFTIFRSLLLSTFFGKPNFFSQPAIHFGDSNIVSHRDELFSYYNTVLSYHDKFFSIRIYFGKTSCKAAGESEGA
ncbi:hypothetical protein FTO70_04370 [Methanosarcina sp. KYL-1]|uniref:hypothetical protein n=1 Tax=Methanosarcina sp. KYL-1 TaxID=2602068 RepID=UPI0021013453|nr:hypothetical protein [Methanosarcina sp. KYL-1]MCQ1534936.1 hypothetical protein [Methanosarcina sp. KYL-1]